MGAFPRDVVTCDFVAMIDLICSRKMLRHYTQCSIDLGATTPFQKNKWNGANGCGSVGRAVASNPEVRGSNPVIGKIYIECLLSTASKKTKRGRERPI